MPIQFAQLAPMEPLNAAHLFFRQPWPGLAMLGLLAVAIAYALLLYRRETTLSRWKRITLGTLRAAVLSIILLMLFQPVLGFETILKLPRTVLVLLDNSESMSFVDDRSTEDQIRSAALALSKAPYNNPSSPLSESDRAAVASATRMDLAQSLLNHPETNVFAQLAEHAAVRYFTFGERVEAAQPESLAQAAADAKATALGSSIEEAVARYSGQPIAGVVVLTDGASNHGLEPLAVSRRLQERGIPVFPVGLGLPAPNDVVLERIIVPDTVFHQDPVSVRAQISSRGFANRTVTITATLDGQRVAGKVLRLTGQTQFEELTFVPEREGGTAQLEVTITPLAEEATGANNRQAKSLRIIGEKIKVLYVEGKPRWEYRYLRRVLQRDHRLEVKFLLTEGDRDLAAGSDEYLDDFPEEAARAFHFDLVILGDVPASYFSRTQLARMDELVREHGGSFLMLAGRNHAPGSYGGSPLETLLPVRLRGNASQSVDPEAFPAITSAGRESPVTALELLSSQNQQVWSLVRPMSHLPQLEGAKPAATVLAELTGLPGMPAAYPLIAWQRYGSGKVLFVGTDQLWRMRFKEGDKYHARLWGQAIQFLTMSRLLGENKRIRLETNRRDYRTGERIQISANVLNESFEPVIAPAFNVLLERTQPSREQSVVRLEPVPDIPGLYQGAVAAEQAGEFRLTAAEAEPDAANEVEFHVESIPLEKLEPAMHEHLLKQMAELSGGHYFTIDDLPSLPQYIAGDERTTVIRREKDLWDMPLLLVLVIGLLGGEWFLRRKQDLI